MKRIFLIFAVTVTFFQINSFAQKSGFGIGIILGEPTGLSFKSFTSQTTAIDGAAAWSFANEAAFHVHVDYLLHTYSLINVRKGRLPLYFGIGGRIKLTGKSRLGVRIPVGLSYEIQGLPSDIFLELVPIMDLAPATEFTFNGALGIRFYL